MDGQETMVTNAGKKRESRVLNIWKESSIDGQEKIWPGKSNLKLIGFVDFLTHYSFFWEFGAPVPNIKWGPKIWNFE
jgi:hypothetical protein